MKRRTLAGIVFLLVILGVGIGGHVYLAHALAIQPDWPAPVRPALLAVIGAGLAGLLAQIFLRRRLGIVSRALSWPAYVWLGFAFLLLTATAFTDTALWLLGAASAEPGALAVPYQVRAFAVGAAAAALGAVGLCQGLSLP